MGSCITSNKNTQTTLDENLKNATWKTCEPYVPQLNQVKIIKCYDGDTVTIATMIDDTVVRINVRMIGYDCAEIKSKNAQEKQVAQWAKAFITEMIMNKTVKVVKNQGYDKYGRLLLELEIDGKNVNETMLNMWGVKYGGGHKEQVDWAQWNELGAIKTHIEKKEHSHTM